MTKPRLESLVAPSRPVELPARESTDARWMSATLRIAERARDQHGEVPVGALIVDATGRLVARGCNLNITRCDPSAHAEIVALRRAGRNLGNHRLIGCTLYVSLEPCAMCAMAMIHARLARVVYGAADPKTGAAGSVFDVLISARHNHRPQVKGGVLAEAAGQLLSDYFRDKRGNSRLDPA